MQDVLDEQDELLADDEAKAQADARNQKYLRRFYKQSMSPSVKDLPGGRKHETPGKWIKFFDERPDIYVKDEAHIRRLINEGHGHVIDDPRPGVRSSQYEPTPGTTGPASRPPEPPEYAKKVESLEGDVASLKEGMSQILALLQAQQTQPKQEQQEETAQAKPKK